MMDLGVRPTSGRVQGGELFFNFFQCEKPILPIKIIKNNQLNPFFEGSKIFGDTNETRTLQAAPGTQAILGAAPRVAPGPAPLRRWGPR